VPDGALDAALDELYASDPSDFVAVRKRLSAALRSDGDKDGAKEVLAARRPSTSAWALNQLAREHPQLVDELLEASSALYAAQTRGSHEPDGLRDAIRTHREAVDAATDAALAALGNRANDKFRSEIVSTLRAVSTDDDIREQLSIGRIVREASSAGFPHSTGLTLVPDRAPAKPKSKARARAKAAPAKSAPATNAAPTKPDAAAIAARQVREREQQRRAQLAAKEAARKDTEAAAAEVARTQARVEELETALETARRDERTARERHRKAKSTLRDLR
jgi:hypothetical protein